MYQGNPFVNINILENPKQRSVMEILSCSDNHYPLVKWLLDKYGDEVDLRQQDMYGLSPLANAAKCGTVNIAKDLIQRDPTLINDKIYYTSMYVAIIFRNMEMVKLLLDSGADVQLMCGGNMRKTIADYCKELSGSDAKTLEIKSMIMEVAYRSCGISNALVVARNDSGICLDETDVMECGGLSGMPLLSQSTDI